MIDIDLLRATLHYDPDTGIFTDQSGEVLGHDMGGRPGRRYVGVSWVGGRDYAHRLAWAYMTGSQPPTQLDHKDRDRRNNAWGNLRAATATQNLMNRLVRADSRTRLKGVVRHVSGCYGARLRGKSLGYFNCPAAAHFAYVVAADRAFGEYVG